MPSVTEVYGLGRKTDGRMKWNWIEAEIYSSALRKLLEMSTFGQENKNG
jgi:hypothetical protein